MTLANVLAKHERDGTNSQTDFLLRLYKGVGPAEGKIWVQFFDSDLREVVSRIPGRKFVNGDWLIDEPALKRLILDIYSNPILREKFYPPIAPEFQDQIGDIIREYEAGQEIRNLQTVVVPDCLKYNGFAPRSYQLLGALWLTKTKRAILNFEMGLGKTVTVLTALKLMRNSTNAKMKVVVICPASVKVAVWKNEIQKFSEFSFAVVEGNKQQRIQTYQEDVDILILNYDLLILDKWEITEYLKEAHVLVADEATYLKSNKCKRTQAFREISQSIEICWLLTGTILMNDLKELHTIVNHLDSYLLDSWFNFRETFLRFNGDGTLTVKNLKKLHDRMERIFFRKRKQEVAEQLPEKIFEEIPVELSVEQKAVYAEIRNRLFFNLSRESKNPHWLTVTNALAEMTRLKQVCDSLQLLGIPERVNPKIERLKLLMNGELQGQKVIIFTQFEKMARVLDDQLKEYNPIMLSGSVPVELRESLIKLFQSDPSNKVFITTTAGGMGITLTAASTVILFDQLFNPQMTNQIIGRADRIGNKQKTILVLNLIAENSIECVHRTMMDSPTGL